MHATRLHRSPTARAVRAFLLTAGLATATVALAQPDLRRTRLICDAPLALCLAMSPDRDSDGDGYSDADEKAAGTDPYDSRSQPTLPRLLDLLSRQGLPSALVGRLVIVAPPTVTPDGRPLAGIGLDAYFAGKAGFPARGAALQRLGIDASWLASLGIAPGTGFVLKPGAGVPGAFTFAGAGGQTFGLTGLRMGRIATPARSNPLVIVQGVHQSMLRMPGLTGSISSVGVNAQAASVRVVHGSGATTESWVNNDLIASGTSAQQTTLTGADGKVSGVKESVTTLDSAGLASSYTSVVDSSRMRTEEGAIVATTFSEETTKKTDGTTVTHLENTTLVAQPDGSTSKTVSTTHTVANELIGGSDTTKTVQRENKDASGKVVQSTTTTTQTATNTQGAVTKNTTTCKDASGKACTSTESANPEAVYDTVVLTPEAVARIVTLLHATTSRSGSTVLQHLTPDDLKDPADPTPIVLVDDEGRLQMMLTTPNLWNNARSTERWGTTGVDLQELPPGQTPQDKSLGRLMSDLPAQMPGGAAALRLPL